MSLQIFAFLILGTGILASACTHTTEVANPIDIKTRMDEMKPAFQACYEKALTDISPRRRDQFQGNLTVQVKITSSGQVSEAQVLETTFRHREPRFEDCVLKIHRELKYPTSDANAQLNVRYPLVFTLPAP